MASEKTDKAAPVGFLAVLEAKYAALGKLIESYRTAESLGALGQPGDLNASVFEAMSVFDTAQVSVGGKPVDLPTGAFLGKSLPSAVKLYLSAARKKQTIREIATALKEGGIESMSENFENIVTTALNRLKAAGDVLRFKDGWALAEFYPESLRARIAQDAAPRKKKNDSAGSKVKRKKKVIGAAAKSKTVRSGKKPGGEGLEKRIIAFLDAHGFRVFTPAELAKELSVDPGGMRMALGRMAAKQTVKKHPDGSVGALTKKPDVLKAS